jgi:hypothetical protein
MGHGQDFHSVGSSGKTSSSGFGRGCTRR